MGLLNAVLFILAAVLALSIYFEQRDRTPEISPEDELNEQLIEAAKVGNLLEVKRLVAQARGADIHANFDASLIFAASEGYIDVVKYLVEKEANIHSCDESALKWAAENGHLDIVKYLVGQGADIHAQEDYALIWAASEGQIEVVKFLVGRGAPIDIAKENGTEEVQDFFNTYRPQRAAGGKRKLSKPRKSKSANFKI
ncbi:ankyrin repeat domain-containing protein [Achromobacter anxifer]